MRLLTDPLLHRRVGHLLRNTAAVVPRIWSDLDAVLISHGHLDHLHTRSLRLIDNHVPVIAPAGLARFIARAGFSNITEIAAGESVSVGAATVTAVHAEHDARRHPLAQPDPALGYVICGGEPGERAYFAGDTDLYDEMAMLADAPLGPVDLALLPVWGWGPSVGPGHLNPHGAATAVGLIRPRVAIPIHWGTMFPAGMARFRNELLFDPPHTFARLVVESGESTQVRILSPGQSIDLTATGDTMERR